MSVETKAMDVLAVLDPCTHLEVKRSEENPKAGFVDMHDWYAYVGFSYEARAAIAELIEAASLTRVAVEDDCVPNSLIERLTAALSGVQGGAK